MSDFRKITKEELDKILDNHRHWLHRDTEGWKFMKATLSNIDLSHADLSGVNLTDACIYDVDLNHANLRDANLSSAYLSGVNLTGANLSGVNLSNAIFYNVWLRRANLSGANLTNAKLPNTNLSDANLFNTDLFNADVTKVSLYYADLSNTKNVPYIPMTCPEEGEFIGYKKACDKIVVLSIPADAKRSSAAGRKCRCNKAKVLEIDEIGGGVSDVTEVCSNHDRSFIYRVGEVMSVDNFDDNRFKECAPGIHFFINRKEAEKY